VSVSVCRWPNCRASLKYVCYVICLTAQPAVTIIWLLRDVPLIITRVECFLDLGLLASNSPHLLSGLRYITTAGSCLYLLMDFKVPVELSLHLLLLLLLLLVILCSVSTFLEHKQLEILDTRAPCTVYLQHRHTYTCTHVHTLCAPQITQFIVTTFSCSVQIFLPAETW